MQLDIFMLINLNILKKDINETYNSTYRAYYINVCCVHIKNNFKKEITKRIYYITEFSKDFVVSLGVPYVLHRTRH